MMLYPVIFLTFKYVKYDSWEATFTKISGLLQEEFGRWLPENTPKGASR